MLQNQQSEVSTCFATFIAAIYSKTAKQDVKKTNIFFWKQQTNQRINEQKDLNLQAFKSDPLGALEQHIKNSIKSLGTQSEHRKRKPEETPKTSKQKKLKLMLFHHILHFDDIFMF